MPSLERTPARKRPLGRQEEELRFWLGGSGTRRGAGRQRQPTRVPRSPGAVFAAVGTCEPLTGLPWLCGVEEASPGRSLWTQQGLLCPLPPGKGTAASPCPRGAAVAAGLSSPEVFPSFLCPGNVPPWRLAALGGLWGYPQRCGGATSRLPFLL